MNESLYRKCVRFARLAESNGQKATLSLSFPLAECIVIVGWLELLSLSVAVVVQRKVEESDLS